MRTIIAALLLAVLSFTAAAQPSTSPFLAEKVKQEFLHAWKGYKTYAWGHDELKPISKTYYDWYGVPFYLTALDAMDTMTLMGLTEEADSTREYIATHLNFNQDVFVNVFEFTIRCLGSLISNYQMTKDQRLLNLAVDLADRMLPAFVSGTGMPYRQVNLKTGEVRGDVSNPAEVGTLFLEFGALTQLTGNAKYFNHAKIALLQLYELRSDIDLVGDAIDVTTGEWKSKESHIGGGIDSYYEYVLKGAYLFNDVDCKRMWLTHYAALNKYLLDSSATNYWYGHVNMETGKRTKTQFGALDAFFPAVQVLWGDFERGDRLLKSCYDMWNKFGIEPEEYDYAAGKPVKPAYFLNPEIMESAYYIHVKTNDPKFLSMGGMFLDSLIAYCRTDGGYAELESVVTKKKKDRMQSYFLAETLKYLYLLFAGPEVLEFDKVIFNTEAHPIRKEW